MGGGSESKGDVAERRMGNALSPLWMVVFGMAAVLHAKPALRSESDQLITTSHGWSTTLEKVDEGVLELQRLRVSCARGAVVDIDSSVPLIPPRGRLVCRTSNGSHQ